jgi:protein-S-isoprenylcysteine O-methyltransferase Ste14
VLALLDRLVVSREEAYLERRFGDDYRHYRDAVPRWF